MRRYECIHEYPLSRLLRPLRRDSYLCNHRSSDRFWLTVMATYHGFAATRAAPPPPHIPHLPLLFLCCVLLEQRLPWQAISMKSSELQRMFCPAAGSLSLLSPMLLFLLLLVLLFLSFSSAASCLVTVAVAPQQSFSSSCCCELCSAPQVLSDSVPTL